MTVSSWPANRRTTTLDLRAAKERGERWAMLTSYDSMTAPVFEEAGVRVLLVGDSAAMTVLGHDTTVPITVDELISMSGGVVRSTSRALIVGDLPFGSYETSATQAVSTATRFFKEAGVGAVKLEGPRPAQIEAIAAAGMPVMAHVGLTPQSVHALGGHRVQGRGAAGEELLAGAKTLEAAGAFALVLEAVPAALAARVTEALTIPTIGIGAGASCDAQVLVWQDMAGLNGGHVPRFVKRYADVRSVLSDAAVAFAADVASGAYPEAEHSYE